VRRFAFDVFPLMAISPSLVSTTASSAATDTSPALGQGEREARGCQVTGEPRGRQPHYRSNRHRRRANSRAILWLFRRSLWHQMVNDDAANHTCYGNGGCHAVFLIANHHFRRARKHAEYVLSIIRVICITVSVGQM
jgi:hypothetical protein